MADSTLERLPYVKIALGILITVAGILLIRAVAKGKIFKGIAGHFRDGVEWSGEVLEEGGKWAWENTQDGAKWIWKQGKKGAGVLEEGANDAWKWMKELDVPDIDIPDW